MLLVDSGMTVLFLSPAGLSTFTCFLNLTHVLGVHNLNHNMWTGVLYISKVRTCRHVQYCAEYLLGKVLPTYGYGVNPTRCIGDCSFLFHSRSSRRLTSEQVAYMTDELYDKLYTK